MHKDHHFDTLKFVQKLQEEGFSEEQSVALMRALSDVIEERCVLPVNSVVGAGRERVWLTGGLCYNM
jgi:hypothetical protein